MVVPNFPEPEWLKVLEHLPAFNTDQENLIVISPHPDDETLGAGALIAAQCNSGKSVTIVAVTDGENAYTDYPGLADLRVQEQTDAVQVLGCGNVNIVRVGLQDSGVAAQQMELESALADLITPGCHVIAPWTGDFHPDHEACGRAAEAIARSKGARLSWYFFWTWHRGEPAVLEGLALRIFSFGDDLRRQKWDALLCHQSQLVHPSGDPILPENLLAPARRNFEVFAEA